MGSEGIQDEIMGTEETIDDAALAKVIGDNYAKEEVEDQARRELEGNSGRFSKLANTGAPGAKHTRSGKS